MYQVLQVTSYGTQLTDIYYHVHTYVYKQARTEIYSYNTAFWKATHEQLDFVIKRVDLTPQYCSRMYWLLKLQQLVRRCALAWYLPGDYLIDHKSLKKVFGLIYMQITKKNKEQE